ncbi:hypothetical protein [Anaerosalibacter sp. Marseille-P3206]|uniref:hypothetical protein n=1 Tax=Anaerosalibacter sp. Marseille-P3206 TaxID=1871005 RepID=UPI0009863B61|nr:hypothetical protein [Anaerosalibacter sp. Marseille-P3206]
MSGEFIYTRKYIIFKNDKSNISGINPKGHGLLEVRENKGNLSVNVERCQSDYYYNIYLIGREGENIVETLIGKVITDDIGKGSVELYFNPRNVEGSNNPIENYTGLVLRRGTQVLLIGHIKNDRGILEKYLSNIEVQDDEEVVEEVEVEQEIKEPDEVVKEIVEEIIEEYIEPREDYEEEIVEEKDKPPHTKFKSQMTDYVLSILRFFPYVKPFNVELNGYDWWRIESDGVNIHRGFLPFYNYLLNMYHNYPNMQNTTTCQYLIQKYKHYLFGIYKVNGDARYYIYGVPGSFTTLEHPFRGATGFNTWYESKDGFGYWLIYIDPLTGKVMYTINPMIPTC